ncbi:hypothetical protein HDV00_004952 [Rhizophlyctis rosea]|nr:hypothetical protein HDV00_004952 [Rhizophlyctis rosea]
MTTLQTCADILILLFAHPTITVRDLLTCERVCKQWLLVLRASQHQIWKQKLVDSRSFPPGCLPVLYGHEVWRDVVVLWWAWRRPWEPKDASWLEAEEVEVGDVVPRRDGVVRDVTSAMNVDGPYRSRVKVFGTRPDGQIVVGDGRTKKFYRHIDRVLKETPSPTPTFKNISPIKFKRTNILTYNVESLNDGVVRRYSRVVEWDTGEIIGQRPRRPTGHHICGNHMTEKAGSSGVGDYVKIFPLDDTFAAFESRKPLIRKCLYYDMNETLLA